MRDIIKAVRCLFIILPQVFWAIVMDLSTEFDIQMREKRRKI